MSRWPIAMALVGLSMGLANACGARSELYVPDPARAEGGAPAEGGGGSFVPPECATLQSSSELAPLDMFVMVDASGSMAQALGGTISKWERARDALEAFARDSASTGMSMALSFYPIRDTYIPEYCANDVECGSNGSCEPLRFCDSGMALCDTVEDCVAAGLPNDSCIPMSLGRCTNHLTCQLEANSTPALGLTGLPVTGTVEELFKTEGPDGGTPTRIALRGALHAARQRQALAPDNKVIVLLVTDGFPTPQCDDGGIIGNADLVANVAFEASLGAADGIQTYVVGIFGGEDVEQAQVNFDTIAAAGDSGEAIIVEGALVDALNAVRRRAKPCELALVGNDSDYDAIWLRLISSDDSEPIWVRRRDSFEDCDATPGFYFDVSPSVGTPSRVLLCPDTCSLLGGVAERRVEIVTSCDE